MATLDSGNYTEELEVVSGSLRRLETDTNAVAVVLLDGSGQAFAGAGSTDLLVEAPLSSLTDNAADVAAKLAEGNEFTALFSEDAKQHINVTAVAKRAPLLVVYKEETSSLGLVRLRVRKANGELKKTIQAILDKTPAGETAPLPEITEIAIQALFSK